MPTLTNNELRAQMMSSFLQRASFDTEQTLVSSVNDMFSFRVKNAEDARRVTEDLAEVFKTTSLGSFKPQVKSVSLEALLVADIEAGKARDERMGETNKKACLAVIQSLVASDSGSVLAYEQDIDSGEIIVTLPNPVYAQFFSMLDYEYLHVEDGVLYFDLNKYLKTLDEDILVLDDGQHQAPLVFMRGESLEKSPVLYVANPVDGSEDEVDVTPYFMVPKAVKPPSYHFVLDMSGSMNTLLPSLKDAVLRMAEMLFEFQEEAVLNVSTFASDSDMAQKPLGAYNRGDWTRLKADIESLNTRGSTKLYRAALSSLSAIEQSQAQHNVLLFTDGLDDGALSASQTAHQSEVQLQQRIRALETAVLLKARNKFYIVSYHQRQPKVLNDLASLFASLVIDTDSADFIAALKDKGVMKNWAQARDLFTYRVVVENADGVDVKQSYCQTLDMSGQFHELATTRYHNGDKMTLTITNGVGDEVVIDERTLSLPAEDVAVLEEDAVVEQGLHQQVDVNALVASSPLLQSPQPQAQEQQHERESTSANGFDLKGMCLVS